LHKKKLLKNKIDNQITMSFTNEYDSENEDLDTVAPFTDEILEEFELDKKLRIISSFKNFISNEPEFYGINKINDVDILDIIESGKTKLKNTITIYQNDLFDDLYNSLYGNSGNNQHYNFVYSEIMKKIKV